MLNLLTFLSFGLLWVIGCLWQNMRCRICSTRHHRVGVKEFYSSLFVLFAVRWVTGDLVLKPWIFHREDALYIEETSFEVIQLLAISQGRFLRKTEVTFPLPRLSLLQRWLRVTPYLVFALSGTRWAAFTASVRFRWCWVSCQSQNKVTKSPTSYC